MLTDQDILGSFLNIAGYDCLAKENRFSTLTIAIKGARKITARDIETGIPVNPNTPVYLDVETILEDRYHTNLLIGLTCYLIILDLLGNVIMRTDIEKHFSKDGIQHILRNFSNLDTSSVKAIKQLRNCLTHNFSLANQSYDFELSTEFPELLSIDTNQKSKNNKLKETHATVKINEYKLCQQVEDIYNLVRKEFVNDSIKLKKGVTSSILKLRFTIQ